MTNFKPGDEVRCIDEGTGKYVQNGTIYTVSELYEIEYSPPRLILEGLSGLDDYDRPLNFFAHRFELVEEKPKFEPGDKVRCIDSATSYLVVGDIYTVKNNDVTSFNKKNGGMVRLEELGENLFYCADRFELVQETELETAIKEIVEGNLIHKSIDTARTNIVDEIVMFLNEKYNLI